MTDFNIKFNHRGFASTRRELQAMRERAANLSPAWDALLSWWAERNVTHFRNRGKRWKTPWKPLAPVTLREKLRLGFPLDPLIRTGELRDSLTTRPLGVERIFPHEVEAGTAVRYAGFHQSGVPQNNLPARKLINARQVSAEGVASNAVINWIVNNRRSTRSSAVER